MLKGRCKALYKATPFNVATKLALRCHNVATFLFNFATSPTDVMGETSISSRLTTSVQLIAWLSDNVFEFAW